MGIMSIAKEIATAAVGSKALNSAARGAKFTEGIANVRYSQLLEKDILNLADAAKQAGGDANKIDKTLNKLREKEGGISGWIRDNDFDTIDKKLDSMIDREGFADNEIFQDALKEYDKHEKYLQKGIGVERSRFAYNELADNSGKLGLGNLAMGYFGEEGQRTARAGMVGVGASTFGIATRYLSGGDMMTDARGNRNIAGVPFF